MGEGPCVDAYHHDQPVLPHLAPIGAQRLGEAIAVALYMLPALAIVIVVLARYMRRGRRS